MNVKKFGRPKRKERRERKVRKRNQTHLILKESRKRLESGKQNSSMIKLELQLLDVQVNHTKDPRKNSKSSSINKFISHSLITRPEGLCGAILWRNMVQGLNLISH